MLRLGPWTRRFAAKSLGFSPKAGWDIGLRCQPARSSPGANFRGKSDGYREAIVEVAALATLKRLSEYVQQTRDSLGLGRQWMDSARHDLLDEITNACVSRDVGRLMRIVQSEVESMTGMPVDEPEFERCLRAMWTVFETLAFEACSVGNYRFDGNARILYRQTTRTRLRIDRLE